MFKNLAINSSRKSTHIFFIRKDFLQNINIQADILPLRKPSEGARRKEQVQNPGKSLHCPSSLCIFDCRFARCTMDITFT